MARGMFRLWLVASVLWISFAFLGSSGDSRPDAVTILLEIALVPPGVILIIGLMLGWAFKGFSRRA